MTWSLTVTDLKQWSYCPRIPFYDRCLPGVRPVTAKMDEGIHVHDDAASREKRRQLRSYGFETGERHFNVSLYSSELGMVALVDMVILRPDNKPIAVPVDYKLSSDLGEHFKLQLACYALLLEEEMELPVPYAFLYLIPERRAERIALSTAAKQKVRAYLVDLRICIEEERMPQGTRSTGRCVNCEFRRFCNDIK